MSEIKFLEKLTNHLEKLPGVGKKQLKDMRIILQIKCQKKMLKTLLKI